VNLMRIIIIFGGGFMFLLLILVPAAVIIMKIKNGTMTPGMARIFSVLAVFVVILLFAVFMFALKILRG